MATGAVIKRQYPNQLPKNYPDEQQRLLSTRVRS